MKNLCLFWLLTLLNLVSLEAVNAASLTVVIGGVKGEELNNIIHFLDIEKEKSREELLAGRIKYLHQQAPEQIQRALQVFGYYKSEIVSKLTVENDNWTAHYRVDPGPLLKIGQVELLISGEGENDTRFIKLSEDFPLKTGEPLQHAVYEQAKKELQRLSIDRGYLDADFTKHRVNINLADYTATVVMHFDTGTRYHIGDIYFIQTDDVLINDLLKRYVPFKSGDYYSSKSLLNLQSVLSNSDYFAHVEVRSLKLEKDKKVNVEVLLEPKKRSRYRFGIGYDTDTGARVTFSHTRRINPRGHLATIKIKNAERQKSVDAQYLVPLKRPAFEQLAYIARYTEEDTVSRSSQTTQLGLRRSEVFDLWQQNLGLVYEQEDFIVADNIGDTLLLIPSITVVRTETDERLYPRNGWRFGVDLLGSSDQLGSDITFVQTRLNTKWLHSLQGDNKIILRAELGATDVSSVEILPASKRFYAGGDMSIRGYNFEELGPLNDNGDVIGGKFLLVASAEFEMPLAGKWSWALFYDSGNAMNTLDEKIYNGAGFGFRWKSPIGPIRIDLGAALDKPGTPWRLHLSLGPDL